MAKIHESTFASAIPPTVETVRSALLQVIDPEAGMNIVDLGLVYRIELIGGKVIVEMTMTSPACPMGDMLMEQVEEAISKVVDSGTQPDIRLVWSPPWDPSLMSEKARQHFGW
ncbi:MAG: metal-sulfur cluster assembly factor [Sterolibacterium sp.]